MPDPIALLVHADPSVVAAYRSALGIPVYTTGQLGSGSSFYNERTGLAREPLSAAVARFCPGVSEGAKVVLIAWSAGCWAVRAWLRDPDTRARVPAAVMLDGLHVTPASPLGGEVDACLEAAAGQRCVVVTHTQIRPPDYRGTTDSARMLLDQMRLVRVRDTDSLHHGGFWLRAFEGTDAAAHIRQLRVEGPALCQEIVRPWLLENDLIGGTSDTDPAPPPDDCRPLHHRALSCCLTEARSWGCEATTDRVVGDVVPATRVAEYLRGCVRGGSNATGQWLASEVLGGKRHSFCAAAQGWSEEQVARPDEPCPPHRAAVREIREDAQQGRRGRWLPIESVRAGEEYPGRGDLAIYWRDSPTSGLGHVDRVIDADENGARTVGANESGGRWVIEPLFYDQHNLLGFVVHDEPTTEPQPETTHLDVDWCEPLIDLQSTPQSRWAARDEWIRSQQS